MSKAVKLHSKAVAPVPTLAHGGVTSVVVRIEHVTRDVTFENRILIELSGREWE